MNIVHGQIIVFITKMINKPSHIRELQHSENESAANMYGLMHYIQISQV